MICIRCQHDSKYSERRDSGGNCPRCNKPFAFETREGALFSDKAFQGAIDAVSAQGKLRWGVEHLYYELCRRKRKTFDIRLVVGLVAVVGVSAIILLADGLTPLGRIGVAVIVSVLALILISTVQPSYVAIPRGDFEKMWDRWGTVHGKVPSAILRKLHPDQPSRGAHAAEPDLEDYSFDRAIICDRARTVDLLLANNFHFENNCAVLSIDGYPKQAFEGVRRMLKRNPRLEVYALHDATPEGCRLAWRLSEDAQWFKGQARIVDVGLRPVHAAPFKGLLLSASTPVSPGHGISDSEARWLSSHRLEIAAIRPEQVLRRLFKAISRQPAQPSLAPGASTPSASSPSRGAGAAVAASTVVLAGTAAAAAAAQRDAQARAAGAKNAKDTGGDGGGGTSSDSSGWSFDSESFSADADASDGGADSFG